MQSLERRAHYHKRTEDEYVIYCVFFQVRLVEYDENNKEIEHVLQLDLNSEDMTRLVS